MCRKWDRSALQRLHAVTVYFTSKQLPSFGCAGQCRRPADATSAVNEVTGRTTPSYGQILASPFYGGIAFERAPPDSRRFMTEPTTRVIYLSLVRLLFVEREDSGSRQAPQLLSRLHANATNSLPRRFAEWELFFAGGIMVLMGVL